VTKKRKKNNVVVLAELWLTDKDGKPQKIKITGHKRSVKKRMKLAEIERQINGEVME
jgi:hypothetical protein